MEFELETSLGRIVVTETESGDGIWIDLVRDDAEMEMGIARIAVEKTKKGKPKIIVEFINNAGTKNHTHIIKNKTIEEYFAD